jgi:hypothetical protein
MPLPEAESLRKSCGALYQIVLAASDCSHSRSRRLLSTTNSLDADRSETVRRCALASMNATLLERCTPHWTGSESVAFDNQTRTQSFIRDDRSNVP